MKQGLARLLKSASGASELVGPADQVLEPFIGFVGEEQTAGTSHLGACAVRSAHELLAAGLGLDDHLLHDVVKPGELARPNVAGLGQDQHGEPEKPRQGASLATLLDPP